MSNIEQKVFCSRCRRKTNHSIIESSGNHLKFVETLSNKGNTDLRHENIYYIAQCNGCDNISFVQESKYESIENGERIWKHFYHVYPDPMERMDHIENISFKNLPDEVFLLITEVHVAYIGQIQMLTAAGLRMIVEAICKDKAIAGRNLYEKIESLKATGIISESQRLVLHEIRLLGNDTVHEIISPKDILIKEGINTINSILYNVYGIEGFSHIDS